MTVSGVRSSWLASAANSRWRRSARRCAASESRIGHERPARVHRAEGEGDEDDDRPADEQHADDGVLEVRCSAVRSWTTWRKTGPTSADRALGQQPNRDV